MPDKPTTPVELETGIPIIDAEHQRLRELIGQLQGICDSYCDKFSCSGCGDDRILSCEQQLIACLTEILGFMVDHFSHEERLLKSRHMTQAEKDLFAVHVEDHVQLIENVVAITTLEDLQRTVRRIAETAAILDRWITEHIRRYDVPMLQ